MKTSDMITLSADQADTLEDVGFFFSFLGGLQFRQHQTSIKAAGHSRLLVSSSKYGIVFFSDLSGNVQHFDFTQATFCALSALPRCNQLK